MAKEPAHLRVKRLLSAIPWVVANPGVKVEEIADRFGYDQTQLLEDLEIVYMIGLPPYTPDALVDVEIDADQRVTIRLADFFRRPLRLTPEQGLALLAATEANRNLAGDDPYLYSALKKLADQLGVDSNEVLDVDLGPVDSEVIARLREALNEACDVSFDYFSFARDEVSNRNVSPNKLFADSGHWYLSGWCHRAGDERLFRVDRINNCELLGATTVDRGEPVAQQVTFSPDKSAPRVTLRLKPASLWVLDAYPYEQLKRVKGGEVEVTLVVMAASWLSRLLIKLGESATVVSAEGIEPKTAVLAAIRKVQQRYLKTADVT